MKKIISVLLTVVIVFSCFALFAAGASAQDNGSVFGFIAKISEFIKKITSAIKVLSPAEDTQAPTEAIEIMEPELDNSAPEYEFGHFNPRAVA